MVLGKVVVLNVVVVNAVRISDYQTNKLSLVSGQVDGWVDAVSVWVCADDKDEQFFNLRTVLAFLVADTQL